MTLHAGMNTPMLTEALRRRIAELEAENERLRANWPKHHGCACRFDDEDNIIGRCKEHVELEDEARRKALEEATALARWMADKWRRGNDEALKGMPDNHALDVLLKAIVAEFDALAAAIRELKDKP